MNINPTAASLAGTARAASRGGETDNQATEAARRQTTADQPGGKSAETSEIDAGEQTGDRDGNGRQLLDVFQHAKPDQEESDEEQSSSQGASRPALKDGSGNHLDLEC